MRLKSSNETVEFDRIGVSKLTAVLNSQRNGRQEHRLILARNLHRSNKFSKSRS
jgi:hypothetical protein